MLVVEPGHPLAGLGQIELTDLAGLRFVSLQKSSTVQGIRDLLEKHGVVWSKLQVVMVCCPSLTSSIASKSPHPIGIFPKVQDSQMYKIPHQHM